MRPSAFYIEKRKGGAFLFDLEAIQEYLPCLIWFLGLMAPWGVFRGLWYAGSVWMWGAVLCLFVGKGFIMAGISLFCWVLVCGVMAESPARAFLGLDLTYSNGIAQFVLIWVLGSSGAWWAGGWRGLVKALRVAVAVMGLWGLCQFVDPKLWGMNPSEAWTWRAYGTLGSPVYLGGWLAVAGVYAVPGGGWVFWLAWAVGLLATKTRGALLAAGIGLSYLAWVKASKAMRWTIMVRMTLFLALAYLLIMSLSVHRSIGKSDSARVLVWKTSVEAVKARPLFGWGPENTLLAIEAKRPRDGTWEAAYGTTTQDHAHNSILEAAVSLGIPGAVLFLLACVAVWESVLPGRARGALAALAVFSMFNPVGLAVKILAATIVGHSLKPRARRKIIRTDWARLLAVFSLCASLYCWRNAVKIRDTSIPLPARISAGLRTGYLQ